MFINHMKKCEQGGQKFRLFGSKNPKINKQGCTFIRKARSILVLKEFGESFLNIRV